MTNTTSDAMKYFRNLTFIVTCVVVCCVMPIVSGCSQTPLPAGKFSGTILAWNSTRQYRLDLQTGMWRYNFWGWNTFKPNILCKLVGDTVMVKNSTWIFGSDDLEIPDDLTSYPIHKYAPFDSTFEFVESIGDSSFFCTSLAYNQDSKTFFYGGRFQSVKGGFLLDSSFNLIRKLTAIPEKFSLRGKHFFVGGDKIILTSGLGRRGTYVYDLNTDKMTRIGDFKRLLSITPDKKHILSAEGNFSQGPLTLAIYDFQGNKTETLPIDDYETGDVCYSPSGKQLAYSALTGLLHDVERLKIYDFETKETYLTSDGGFGGHSLLWIEKRMPEFK